MVFESLERILKNFLLTNLEISLKNKILKRSKLEHYVFKDLYIDFIFDTDGTPFKLPIPFEYEYYKEDNILFMDYRTVSFKKKSSIPNIDTYLHKFIPIINGGSVNKYFNNIVEIRSVANL
jgi:hypothetical protein